MDLGDVSLDNSIFRYGGLSSIEYFVPVLEIEK